MENGFFEMSADGAGGLRITGQCTVECAAELKERLLEFLVPGGDVVLDVSGVESADATFFQLLIAAFNSSKETGDAFRCRKEMSEAVREAAELAGLYDHSGLKDFWVSEV